MENNNTTTNDYNRQLMRATVPMYSKGRSLHKKYDLETLLDIVRDIRFDKVTIPVNAYCNEYFDEDRRGTMNVGYIESFNEEDLTFDIVIRNKYSDRVFQYDNAIIYPKVSVSRDGEVLKVLSFDICSYNYYAAINN